MRQFGDDQAIHGQGHGGFGAREREHDQAAGDAGARAAEHRGRAHLLEAQHPEQLAESRQRALDQAAHHFVRAIARRDPRAARRDDRIDAPRRQVRLEQQPDRLGIVLDQVPDLYPVPRRLEPRRDGVAAAVGRLGARVAHRDDRAHHRGRCRRPVVFRAHLGDYMRAPTGFPGAVPDDASVPMHVILTGFSPALEARVVALLGPGASCRVLAPASTPDGRPASVLLLGDALSPDATRAVCQRARSTEPGPLPAIALVASVDPVAQRLASEQLIDAVVDPDSGDAQIALQVTLLGQMADRLARDINERRHAMRAVADTAPVLLWVTDETGQCTFANMAYTQFVGCPFDQLRGMGWKAFVHPDDRPAVDEPLAEAVATQHEADLIYRFRRFDGEWRWILDRSVPRFRPDGTFAGLIGSCTDITDLRHAEDDLRVARDLAVRFAHASGLDDVLPACLAAALEVSDYTEGGIYLRDPDGALRVAQTLNVSPALRESLMYIAPGSERMAIVERGDPVFVDYARVPFAPNDVALAEGVTGLAMLPLHHQDEVVGLLLLASDRHGALAPARRGPLEAIAAQMSTALARLLVEDALARSERLLRTVVEHAPIAIWTLRPDGTVGDVWNPAAERLFGVTHADAVGRACPACLPATGRDPALRVAGTTGAQPGDLLHRLFASSSIHDEQIQRQRPDGTLVEILLYATPLRSRAGAVTSAVAIGVDITERKQFEARLVRAQKQESLGALAGGLAHDFNNLLTGILGYIDLARADLEDPEHPVHELLALAEDSARRATQVTRQMLAYSGGGTFLIEPIDLAGVVSQTLPLLSAALRKATLVTDLGSDLPPIDGDIGQVRQLLINLVTNAVEALPEGTGTVTVRARHERVAQALPARSVDEDEVSAGDYVVLTVSDTGTGIDAPTRARIFDPFFSTKFVGRGLGLPAVLGIVRGHHGYLRIETAPGRGTHVRVFIPVAAEEEEDMVTPLDPVPAVARRRVLLVDDEAGVLYVASQALARAGFEVLTASSGADALRCVGARADDIGLVILDLTMPELDGRDTLIALRKLRPSLRVVLTSGYSEQEALREFGDGTLAGFLQKPFGPRTLIDCVTRAIGLPEAP